MDYRGLIQQADQYIREGQAQKTADLFAPLSYREIPRRWRLPLADIARRSGLISAGLKILSPAIVTKIAADQPTDAEKCGYAALLQKNGSVKEALKWLASVDEKNNPEANLYKAFCLFSRWEYEAAVDVLQTYVEHATGPYPRLVGRLNLAAALVTTRSMERALSEITQILKDAPQLGAPRLAYNALELRSQVHLHSGDFKEAEKDIQKAASAIGREQTSDQLFVEKWTAIITASRDKNSAPLEAFRKRAVARAHWESVREADLYLLKVKFNSSRFNHIFFGTPFPAYRQRIISELGITAPLPKSFCLKGSGPVLDISGSQSPLPEAMASGGNLHRLLLILFKDLYQPARLGTLFAELFPGEYFNPYSSPNRVHQALRRLRRATEKSGFELSIEESNGGYKVRHSCPIRLGQGQPETDTRRLALQKLSAVTGHSAFTSSQAQAQLGLSESTALRLLRWGVSHRLLSHSGKGRATRYSFTDTKQAA